MYEWTKWDNMATQAERLAVVETKVDNLKQEVNDNHQDLKLQLKTMYDASCTQHAALSKEMDELKKFKNKWTYLALGGIAVLGFVSGHLETIVKLLK